jgi:hypothetical protein
MFSLFRVIEIGLSEGHMPENTYAFSPDSNYFLISGHKHSIEWPSGAIKPTWKGRGYVYGCGLLLSSDNEFAIFFTGNGRLIGNSFAGWDNSLLNKYSIESIN